MKIIKTKQICRTLLKVVAIALFAQAAYAEVTLKLGTTGRLFPIFQSLGFSQQKLFY
jgi:hypothetical protein